MSPAWTILRRRLAAERLIGTFIKLPALEAIDLAAERLDFVVVDLEHSQLDELGARRLVRHAHAIGLPALVRLPLPDRERVNRILEAGAAGIQVPTVRRAATLEAVRAAMRYAPAGERSISLAQTGAGYGSTPLREFLDGQDAGPLLVAQIETATTDDPLERIAAARPDVLFVGALDLTVDLEHDAERLRTRVGEIASAAATAGIPLGGAGIDDEALRYDLLGSDVALLRAGLGRALEERRKHVRGQLE